MARNIKIGGQYGLSPKSESMILHEVGRVMHVIRPFFFWPLTIFTTILVRMLWPANIYVAVFFVLVGLLLSLYVLGLSHDRGRFGRAHAASTVLLMMWFIAYVDLVGNTSSVLFISLIGIPLVCFTWSVRNAIRQKDNSIFETDSLTQMFERAGMGETKMNFKMPKPGSTVKNLLGHFLLPRGEKTPDDVIRNTKKIESGLAIPPGSLTVIPNENRGDVADFTISDPRVLKSPLTWPGPSRVGKSVNEPISVGLWQDGEAAEWKLVDQHCQIMGMTGAGKSLGAGWSTLAELITRNDVAVFAADITKGDQTLGPLRPALHRIETTRTGARDMLLDIQAAIRPRTDYLAAKGLAKWEKDCGLTYIVVWLEEAPDIIDSLGERGEARFISSLKAARSAGISFFLSLQRSDWSQLPTIARGQLAKWCFGVAESSDAGFGLSELQNERDARPELWGMRHPGMAYLDAPGVPEDRVAMPMRTWFFGNNSAKIAQHALEYQVSSKPPIDAVTVAAMNTPPIIAGTVIDEDNRDEISTDGVGGDEELTAPSEFMNWKFRLPDAVTDASSDALVDAVEARSRLRQWIIDYGHESFTVSDLKSFRAQIGFGRAWLYKVLHELEDADFIEQDEKTSVATWHVIGMQPDDWMKKARSFIDGGADRARQYGAPVDQNLKPEQMEALYKSTECYYCGIPLSNKREIDHKIPLAKGGQHALSNLAATCSFCNESKGDDTEAEFRARIGVTE